VAAKVFEVQSSHDRQITSHSRCRGFPDTEGVGETLFKQVQYKTLLVLA
jgi:hypothetical protein